jgi:hypothetical protein
MPKTENTISSNLTRNRIVLIVVVIIALLASYVFAFSTEVRNFVLSSCLLLFELIELFKLRKELRRPFIFRVWSREWMIGSAFALFLLYTFADDAMNYWNAWAIAAIVLYGLLLLDEKQIRIVSGRGRGNYKFADRRGS